VFIVRKEDSKKNADFLEKNGAMIYIRDVILTRGRSGFTGGSTGFPSAWTITAASFSSSSTTSRPPTNSRGAWRNFDGSQRKYSRTMEASSRGEPKHLNIVMYLLVWVKMRVTSRTYGIIIAVIVIVVAMGVGAWYVTRAPAPTTTTTTTPAVEKRITIAWTEGPEFDFIESKLPEFEAATGIEVTLAKIPRTHIAERLMLELLHPTGAIHGTALYVLEQPTLAGTGKLVNLYDYKPKSEWIKEGYYEDQLTTNEIGGKLYITPSIWNGVILLYYQKEYFENEEWKDEFMAWPGRTMSELRVPRTPEELLEVAKFFHEKVSDKYSIFLRGQSVTMGSEGPYLYIPLAHYFGGGIYDDTTGEVLINKPGSIRALEYLTELMKYAQPTVLTDGTFEAQLAILEGRCIMADQASYMVPMLNDPTVSKVVGKVKIAMRPFPQCSDALGVAILDTPKKDLVWEFVEWTSSYDIVKGICLTCPNAVGGRRDVAESPEIAGSEWINPALDGYGRVWPLVKLVENPRALEIYEAMMHHLHLACAGEESPSEACAHAAAEIEDITRY
jgi:sorbitol/mannitol transport system substrate-binding protein